jgi:anti-anti-sigma factor
MEMSLKKNQDLTILEIHGRLDTSNYLQVEGRLLEEIVPDSNTLIDCHDLAYISSSGLRVLLLALLKSEQARSKLALCSLPPVIMEIFKISAFDKIFTIYPNAEEAAEKLRNK